MLFHCGFVRSFFITYKAEHFFKFLEGGLFGILCIVSLYPDFFFFNDVVCLYLIHLLEVLCIFWVIIFFSTMRYENISPVSDFFLLYCYLLMLRSFTTIVVFLLGFFSSLESMGFWFIQFERLLFGSCIVRVGTSW